MVNCWQAHRAVALGQTEYHACAKPRSQACWVGLKKTSGRRWFPPGSARSGQISHPKGQRVLGHVEQAPERTKWRVPRWVAVQQHSLPHASVCCAMHINLCSYSQAMGSASCTMSLSQGTDHGSCSHPFWPCHNGSKQGDIASPMPARLKLQQQDIMSAAGWQNSQRPATLNPSAATKHGTGPHTMLRLQMNACSGYDRLLGSQEVRLAI